MNEWAINRQFKSTEAARQKNKQEEKLSQLNFKKYAEAECKFKIDQINKEQRLVEKDLERIRMGVHKSPANASLLGPEKKFHHPHFHVFQLKDAEKRHKRHQFDTRKHHTEMNLKEIKNGDDDEENIDAFMIIEYLGRLQHEKLNDIKPDLKNTSPSKSTIADIDRGKSPVTGQSNTVNESMRSDTKLNSTGKINQTLNDQTVTSIDQSSSDIGKITNTDMTSLRNSDMKERPMDTDSSLNRVGSDGSFKRKKSVTLVTDVTSKSTTEKDTKINDGYYSVKQEKGKDEFQRRQSMEQDRNAPDVNMDESSPFLKAYAEAGKARYIRTSKPLERDRELSPNEIFDKTTK